MNKYVIIVAGGEGTRMNADRPKQFLELEGKPILVHTINRFLQIDSIQVVLVLPEKHLESWIKIKKKHFPEISIWVEVGGSTRTASVMSGLSAIENDGLVAIHDAVRPHVSMEIISTSFDSAEKYGSGVAAVQLKDSIRELDGEKSTARNREDFALVQTPQTFRVSEIKAAYEGLKESVSDDATVYEKAGYEVRLVEGNYSNLKITTPEDLR